MKRLTFLASILVTIAAFLVACLIVLATLFWLVRRWNRAPWVVCATGLILMGVAVALTCRWWRLPAERRFRFSLRGMLVGFTLFAFWFGLVGMDLLRCAKEGAGVRDLLSRGVMLNHFPLKVDWVRTRIFLLRNLSYDPFQKTQHITIRGDEGLPALLEHARDLPFLERVDFDARVTTAGMNRVRELGCFPDLQYVSFLDCAVTDAEIEQLTECKRLEGVILRSCSKITDEALMHLQKLPELKDLYLLTYPTVKMPLSDAGLTHVGQMAQLQHLSIDGIPVSDEGLAHLQRLKNIEYIGLSDTHVTETGVNALCEALPDCFVAWQSVRSPAVSQIRQIEVWTRKRRPRRLAVITDRDRIAAIKEWLDHDDRQQFPDGSAWRQQWRDGPSGAGLDVRFEGHHRRLCEIGLGNGVYEQARSYDYRPISASDEEQIRSLFGIDTTEWYTRETVD